MKLAVPVIRVSSSKAAEKFYCEGLGFTKRSTYRPDPTKDDPCYFVFIRGEARIHVHSFPGGAPFGSDVQIQVDDVDALHDEFVARGVPIRMAPTDQDWGNREMGVRDADGNNIGFAMPRR
jgi:uncharacterized glyoxalase superfamily protein PhnB